MRNLIIVLFFGLWFSGMGQVLMPVNAESSITFKIRNFGLTVDGSFSGLRGEIHFDPIHPEVSRATISVDASTINTGIDLRDKHLRNEDYFHVEKFPELRFVSSKITATNNPGKWKMTGDLTIRQTTKEVSFFVEAKPLNNGYIFSCEFPLNRRDFGVGGSSISLADELKVFIKIIAKP